MGKVNYKKVSTINNILAKCVNRPVRKNTREIKKDF